MAQRTGLGPKTANTFSNSAVPQGYVAGVGRGAMGFTTRSDIGPARPAAGVITLPSVDPIFGQAPVGYVAGRGRGMGELARDQGEMPPSKPTAGPAAPSGGDDDDKADYSESNYDQFSGYGERLFKSTPYDDEDAEADQIYDMVDDYMDNRKKRKREMTLLEQQRKRESELTIEQQSQAGGSSAIVSNRPKITEQFADLKRGLSKVSVAEWESIPDIGDHSLKYTQSKKKDTFSAAPDFLLADASSKLQSQLIQNSSLGGSSNGPSGFQTAAPAGLAEARGTVLSLKLDRMSDSVSGQTVVDPKGYLTSMNSQILKSDADIGDIKKARMLLSSVTTTNPKHAPGWIAAARLEEYAGKIVDARKVIREGCEICPDSEDVWLEAARLHASENARKILASAVRAVPTSVKLWLKAADLETIDNQKKIVLRNALEIIPNSVKLWKTAIELEDVDDARIMLARAVECVPHAVDMWLALAKLETRENARKVLNRAREANPTEYVTWITAAKLEEAHGNTNLVDRIIEKMVASLSQYQVVIGREMWITEAEACEDCGAVVTCRAIIKSTILIGVDEEDRMNTLLDDAQQCLEHVPKAVETARAIHTFALSLFPKKKTLWLAAAMLEKDHGTAESLEALLKEAVKNCPKAEILWLMAAKEKWLAGNIPDARAVLVEAFDSNPESVQIWLAAVKLEWENKEFQRARALLAKARERAPCDRVWMKSALLEEEAGSTGDALRFVDEGIARYPSFSKFYLMGGNICWHTLKDTTRARDYYQKGLQTCNTSVPLWLLSARLDEETKGATKARSLLEVARLKLPESDELWLESIRFERRCKNDKIAETLMAKALQARPSSGLLWAEEVLTCPKQQQKSKSVDALKKCDNDPFVIISVARIFEKDRKIAKARKWFDRVVALEPRLGDAWAHYYALELRQLALQASEGGTQALESLAHKCQSAEPNRGELWTSVAKRAENRHLKASAVLKKVAEQILLVDNTALI